jgi:hypothetical protein
MSVLWQSGRRGRHPSKICAYARIRSDSEELQNGVQKIRTNLVGHNYSRNFTPPGPVNVQALIEAAHENNQPSKR